MIYNWPPTYTNSRGSIVFGPHRLRLFCGALALALLLPPSTSSAQVEWTNTTNGHASYDIGSNWSEEGTSSAEPARFDLLTTSQAWWDVAFFNKDADAQYLYGFNSSGGAGAFSDFSTSIASTLVTINGLDGKSYQGGQNVTGVISILDGDGFTKLVLAGTSSFAVLGNLSLRAGAIFENTALIGLSSASSGTAKVMSSGSVSKGSRYFHDGYGVAEMLKMEEGGVGSNGARTIGPARVTGSGSVWDNLHGLYLGRSHSVMHGTRRLTMAEGGVADGAGRTKLGGGTRPFSPRNTDTDSTTISGGTQPLGINPAIADAMVSRSHKATASRPNLANHRETIASQSGSGAATTGVGGGTFEVNSLLGADRYYNHTTPITGQNTITTNLEAGFFWNGHETLQHVVSNGTNFVADATYSWGGTSISAKYDRHATWASMLIGGRATAEGDAVKQQGIAYGTDLRSGAIAAAWVGSAYAQSFSINYGSFVTPYQQTFGVADVVNSSWGFEDAAGIGELTVLMDAYAFENPTTTYVVSAGNSGAAANTVGSPGSGYNAITVAALTNGNTYDVAASFSSRGPQDFGYLDLEGNEVFTTSVRAAVDIAAPGTSLVSAFYGGQNGGNNTDLTGSNDEGSDAAAYSSSIAGTSFSAPLVAGGAALVASAAKTLPALSDNPSAHESVVVKALLLNGAEKTTGWDNGQELVTVGSDTYISTDQSLDWVTGAGRMNLNTTFDLQTGGQIDVAGTGTGDVGNVVKTGWDYGESLLGVDNSYVISDWLRGGATFTTTLTWLRNREFDSGTLIFDDVAQADLNLSLWALDGSNQFTTLIAKSESLYNTVEHLSLTLADSGSYGWRVEYPLNTFDNTTGSLWGNAANPQNYAVSWQAVPATWARVQWTNTASSDAYYENNANWSDEMAPSATEQAHFDQLETYQVWWDASTVSTAPEVGTFEVLQGGVTFLNKAADTQYLYTINGADAFADFSISGASTLVTISGLHFKSLGGGQIVGGATLTLDGSHAQGSQLTMAGSTGFDVSGNLILNAGAILASTDGFIGYLSDSSGNATVTGSGSAWNNSGSLYVGGTPTAVGGSGSLTIAESGLVDVGGTTKLWSSGSLTLAGGSLTTGSLDNDGTLRINSAGTLTVEGTASGAATGEIIQTAIDSLVEFTGGGSMANDMSVFGYSFGDDFTSSGTLTMMDEDSSVAVDSGATVSGSGGWDGTGGLTKKGVGQLTLTGDNSFSGALTVEAGIVELATVSGSAAGAVSGVSVSSGATLLLGGSNQVADAAAITLSGGTISRSGGVSETMGGLSLTAASTIDYGSGGTGTLAFGAYESGSTPDFVLTVNNFATGNLLSLGSDLSSYLSSAAGTSFSNSYFSLNGMSAGGFTSAWDSGSSTFSITSVPEPSTYLAGGLLLLLMGGSVLRRHLAKVRG